MLGVGLSRARIWTFLGSLRGGDPVIEACLFFPCLVAVIEACLTLTLSVSIFLKDPDTGLWYMYAHGHLFSQ